MLLCLLAATAQAGVHTLTRLSVPEDPWLLGPIADGASGGCRIGGDRWVVFHSDAANLVDNDHNASRDVFLRDRATGQLERVSIDTDGLDAPGSSGHPDVDASGRYVVFESFATLAAGAGSVAVSDIYLRDRVTLTTTLVSSTPTPSGHFSSQQARISRSGSHIAFASSANSLVPGDSNGCSDIFVYTVSDGSIERVSVGAAGQQANGCSYRPDLSDDGRYVVFESDAGNLVPDDSNGRRDVFRKDRLTGAIERLSVGPGGIDGDRDSQAASISGDGSRVTFSSSARNLVIGDSNLQRDIFVWTQGGNPSLVRVNLGPGGVQADRRSDDPVLSRDGAWLVYQSLATNLVPGQLVSATAQPFRIDLGSGQQQALLIQPGSLASAPAPSADGLWTCVESPSPLAATDGNGPIGDVFVHSGTMNTWSLQSLADRPVPLAAGNGNSVRPAISADGRHVVFDSLATTLAGGGIDGNPAADVHWLDRDTGAIERHPTGLAGAAPNGASTGATISADGRHVVFTTTASNLVAGNTDTRSDILRLDRADGSLLHVSAGSGPGSGDSDQADISDDGTRIVFRSFAANLVPGDGNGVADIFLWDEQSGLARISVSSAGIEADGASRLPRLSPEGGHAVFVSAAGNLVTADTTGGFDHVFLRDLGTGQVQRVSETPDGIGGAGHSLSADVSTDGDFVALITEAGDLAAGDGTRPAPHVLRWQRSSGEHVDVSAGLPLQYSVRAESVRITRDGRHVLFRARNQVGVRFVDDLWRHDAVTGSLQRLTQRADGSAHAGVIDGFGFDATGLSIVFASDDDALTPDDHNGHFDIYLAQIDSQAGSIGLLPAWQAVGENACEVALVVRRGGGSAGAVSVDYTTVAGTALAGLDYVHRSGTIHFADGDSADRSITISILDDAVPEPDETFQLVLANPQGGVGLGPAATATILIIDDDDPDRIFSAGFEAATACPSSANGAGRVGGWSANMHGTALQQVCTATRLTHLPCCSKPS